MKLAVKLAAPGASKSGMRRAGLSTVFAAAVLAGAGSARADSFGGVAGNEKSYVLGRDKICTPLDVEGGKTRGVPRCLPATTAEIASLSLKNPTPERGGKAEVEASAKGRTLTVTRKTGEQLVRWDAPDPIASVVEVWRSTYGRLVIVEYSVRRAGREVHEVVGFDLGVGGGAGGDAAGGAAGAGGAGAGGAGGDAAGGGPAVVAPPADPAVDKAVARARKARGKAAVAAWGKVLALDGEHGEALYRVAAGRARAGKTADAVASLERLARSPRSDAIEWLIEARTDKAFAKLLGDPRFRAAVGFDRPAKLPYERLMGFGGKWEQSLVPCDRPEIRIAFMRDRSFRLDLRSACSGVRETFGLRGTWALHDQGVELHLPNPDGGDDVAPCVLGRDHDEDVVQCMVDADLSFEARPVRR